MINQQVFNDKKKVNGGSIIESAYYHLAGVPEKFTTDTLVVYLISAYKNI
jgi:hypothetical protein